MSVHLRISAVDLCFQTVNFCLDNGFSKPVKSFASRQQPYWAHVLERIAVHLEFKADILEKTGQLVYQWVRTAENQMFFVFTHIVVACGTAHDLLNRVMK